MKTKSPAKATLLPVFKPSLTSPEHSSSLFTCYWQFSSNFVSYTAFEVCLSKPRERRNSEQWKCYIKHGCWSKQRRTRQHKTSIGGISIWFALSMAINIKWLLHHRRVEGKFQGCLFIVVNWFYRKLSDWPTFFERLRIVERRFLG